MKEYGARNFALGDARKIEAALSDDARNGLFEYGPIALDPTNPKSPWINEFVFDEFDPVTMGESDAALLAGCRVTRDQGARKRDEEGETVTGNPVAPPTAEDGPQAPAGEANGAGAVQPPAEGETPAPAPRERAPERMEATEVTGYDGRKVSAEIPIGAGRKRLAVRNGVAQPGDATFARMVWNESDKISAAKKRPALAVEVRNALGDTGIPASTISTEYRKWAKFWDVTDEALDEIKANLSDAEKAEIQAAEGEEQRIKREARELEKQASALEREARKEEKKREKEELRAAKKRSKEEADEVKRSQKSEEARKKLEERLAKNSAIAKERAAARAAKEAEKRAEREKALEALRADVLRRNAEALARLEALKNTGAANQASPEGAEPKGEPAPESGNDAATS